MRTYILPESGNLYKVNLHTHSTLSDGAFAPEELKAYYKAHGYSAVAFTDHRKCVPHPELTDDQFIALTGIELDFSSKDEAGIWAHTTHFCGLAKDPMARLEYPNEPLPLSYLNVNTEIAKLNDAGFVTTVNHPTWSDMSTEDVLSLHGMRCIEVFNSVAVVIDNYSDDSSYFEHFTRAGGRALPVAADDCHVKCTDGGPGPEYFRGFNVVKAPELSYDALVQGIENGASFASTGPMFKNLWLDGNILHVECSPVSRIFVHGHRYSQLTRVLEDGDCITERDIDISKLCGKTSYIWVQLCDSQGRKAWAPPYWF